MAIKHGDQLATWFMFREGTKGGGERQRLRYIHRLELQTPDGKIYTIEGEKLPNWLMVDCGESQHDKSLCQVLLSDRPNRTRTVVHAEQRPWPTLRDVANGLIGIIVFQLGIGVVSALAAALAN